MQTVKIKVDGVINTIKTSSDRKERASDLAAIANMLLASAEADPIAQDKKLFSTFSLAALEQCVKTFQELAAANASNKDSQLDLAEVSFYDGNGRVMLEDKDGALAAYQRSITIARDVASDGGNIRAHTILGMALMSVAPLQPDSASFFREALGIFEELDKKGQLPPGIAQLGVIDKIKTQLSALPAPRP
jgi:hypothetical protein